MELSDKRCVPCRGGVPVMGAEEAGRLVSQVSGWTLEVAAVMNGPLLISLLPPEQPGEAAKTPPDQVPCVVAIILLAGFLLSLWMRPPGR